MSGTSWTRRHRARSSVGALLVVVALTSGCEGDQATTQDRPVALVEEPTAPPSAAPTRAAVPVPSAAPTRASSPAARPAPTALKVVRATPPPRTAAPKPVVTAAPKPPPPAAKTYDNCAALNVDYPHGVGRPGATDHTSGKPVTTFTVNQAVYDANTGRDRDKDGIACEKA